MSKELWVRHSFWRMALRFDFTLTINVEAEHVLSRAAFRDTYWMILRFRKENINSCVECELMFPEDHSTGRAQAESYFPTRNNRDCNRNRKRRLARTRFHPTQGCRPCHDVSSWTDPPTDRARRLFFVHRSGKQQARARDHTKELHSRCRCPRIRQTKIT